MARTGISFEDVQNAAESLLGRGLNPTIQRVREALGTGSNTTISEHLKTWQQRLAQTPKIVLPPNVPEAVALALDAFWKIAVQHAEAAFEEQRALATQAIAAAEQARDAALDEQRQSQAEIERLRAAFENIRTAARDLADRLLVEQERRANAETAIQAAEQRARAAAEMAEQTRAETAARAAQIETALQQTRVGLENQLSDSNQRLKMEQQRHEASEIRLVGLIDQLRAEQMAERQTFGIERQDWSQRETAWRESQENQRAENAGLKANLAAAQARAADLTAELQKVQSLRETLETDYRSTLREAESLRGELKAAQIDRGRLQQSLSARDTPSSEPAQAPDSRPKGPARKTRA